MENITEKRVLSILMDTLGVEPEDAHRLAPFLAANQTFQLLLQAQDLGTGESDAWRELCFQSFDFIRHSAGKRGNLGEGRYFFGPELGADAVEIQEGVLVDLIPRAFEKNAESLPEQLKVTDRAEVAATLPDTEILKENVWWLPSLNADETTAVRPPIEPVKFSSWMECFREHLRATLETEKLIAALKADPKTLLTREQVGSLCVRVKRILRDEPNVIPLEGPALVVGDIHGQYSDLLEILKSNEGPEERHLLFLGDYVDRGCRSIPCISLILLLKTKYPDRVHLLRGNHECREVAKIYGFYDELGAGYGDVREEVFEEFNAAFDMLPLAGLIGGKVLGIHAGLSPSIATLRQIQVLNRYRPIPVTGPLVDLVWSDPDEEKDGWSPSSRGAGELFGISQTREFVEKNGLSFVVRSHQLVMPGWHWVHDNLMLTIFSAPNYCYRCANLGGVLLLDKDCQPMPKSYPSAESQKEEATITFAVHREAGESKGHCC